MKKYILIRKFSETDSIKQLIEQIQQLYRDFYIVIVDENQPGSTCYITEQIKIKKGNERLHVLHRSGISGPGSALIDGFKYSLSQGADVIFQMDGDLSHRPEYIKVMLKALENSDLVIGSRYIDGVRVEGWRFSRLIKSKLANMLISRLTMIPLWDFTSGFRCYKRKVIESIQLDTLKIEGDAYQVEMAIRAYKMNFSITEIPITFFDTEYSHSKISKHNFIKALQISFKNHAPFLKILKYLFMNPSNTGKYFQHIKNFGKKQRC